MAAETAEEVWEMMGSSAAHTEERLQEKWSELLVLRQDAPDPPVRGQKPSPETIAAMKEQKMKEDFEEKLEEQEKRIEAAVSKGETIFLTLFCRRPTKLDSRHR